MTYVESVIGFDAREMWLDNSQLWSDTRRSMFLLDEAVEKPLSADDRVWNSVFEIEGGYTDDEIKKSGIRLSWKNVPPLHQYQTGKWTRTFANHITLENIPYTSMGARSLWDDIDRLRNIINTSWGEVWKPTWIIAITELIDSDDTETLEAHKLYGIKPDRLQPEWQLLGYDVADYFFTGFISNAGYKPWEKPNLVSEWKHHFNQYHLFDDVDLALKYVDVAYERDANHGPFSAYGIYLVEDRTSDLNE